MSFLTQSHQVFFGRRLCLIPLTSHVIQRLTQSLSSFRSTSPNYLNLLFLITKLTGYNPKSSEFFTFLPLIQLNPTHPSDHSHFNAIHLQFMFNFHRPGLTAMLDCWWTHVSNAEVLYRSSLSAIDDILHHKRLSLFGHVARLDPGVPTQCHDDLRLTMDIPTKAERQ